MEVMVYLQLGIIRNVLPMGRRAWCCAMNCGQILLAGLEKCCIALTLHCFTDWLKIDKACVERLVEMAASCQLKISLHALFTLLYEEHLIWINVKPESEDHYFTDGMFSLYLFACMSNLVLFPIFRTNTVSQSAACYCLFLVLFHLIQSTVTNILQLTSFLIDMSPPPPGMPEYDFDSGFSENTCLDYMDFEGDRPMRRGMIRDCGRQRG